MNNQQFQATIKRIHSDRDASINEAFEKFNSEYSETRLSDGDARNFLVEELQRKLAIVNQDADRAIGKLNRSINPCGDYCE